MGHLLGGGHERVHGSGSGSGASFAISSLITVAVAVSRGLIHGAFIEPHCKMSHPSSRSRNRWIRRDLARRN
jgi:hypothetical protein